MKERGTVIEKEAEVAVIEIMPHEECKGCGSCGTARSRKITIRGEKAQPLNKGEQVELEMDPSLFLQVVMLIYGLPLAAFLAALLTVYGLSGGPLPSLLAALAATAGTYFLVGRYVKGKDRYSPNITRISAV